MCAGPTAWSGECACMENYVAVKGIYKKFHTSRGFALKTIPVEPYNKKYQALNIQVFI
jgi:hypothetical protein